MNAAMRSPTSSAMIPPATVPTSCASTITTRTVALTRPSCPTPTRAWRIEISVTSNTVTAVSPTSCCPMRNPTAIERGAGRRQRDQQVAERREQERHDDQPAQAVAVRDPLGDERADQRPEPAEGRDHADRPGVQPELAVREQQPGRPEHAPHRRQAERAPQQAAQDRVVRDQAHARPDLRRDRLAVGGGGRRRLRGPDPAQEQRPSPRTRARRSRWRSGRSAAGPGSRPRRRRGTPSCSTSRPGRRSPGRARRAATTWADRRGRRRRRRW